MREKKEYDQCDKQRTNTKSVNITVNINGLDTLHMHTYTHPTTEQCTTTIWMQLELFLNACVRKEKWLSIPLKREIFKNKE